MKHPLLALAEREQLHSDDLSRALNPARVSNARSRVKPYKLADAGGLFLFVLPKGRGDQPRRFWRYKYRINGKEGLYAIGPFPEIGLADARCIHRAARWLVERGIHPAHYARDERERQECEAFHRHASTFETVTEQWIATNANNFSDSFNAQRRRELKKDIYKAIGAKPISEIRKAELKALLERVQSRAPEVARNIRNYLVGIFEYAIDGGLVTGSPVPGRAILRKRNQIPHPALPLERAGEFLRALEKGSCEESTRIAIRLLMLLAVRKSELIEAKWSEFDFDGMEWNIPKQRMKMRAPHFVPLSRQAVELLRRLRKMSVGGVLFPNARDPRRPMAGRSINAVLGRLGYLEGAKPHGFRAMFSTYFNNAHWNPDIIETCLAHKPKDEIRAKYNRAEYVTQRREMMQHWGDHLDSLAAAVNVVALRSKVAVG